MTVHAKRYHKSEKFFSKIISSYIAARTFAQNVVLVGPIFFELRLLFYPDIVVDICEKRQFFYAMFEILNLHVLHVYVSGGERERISDFFRSFHDA